MRVLLFVLIMVVVFALPVSAQDDLAAPQFLYRDGNQLVFINGYTGETTPINNLVVAEGDRFEWSPDGRYLVGYVAHGNARNCLNLFDVDAEVWIYDEPIGCGVNDALFSSDLTTLVYSQDEALSSFSLEDQSRRVLAPGCHWRLTWSPNEQYLSSTLCAETALDLGSITVVVHMRTLNSISVAGMGGGFNRLPIWSPDERWFLMIYNELGTSIGLTSDSDSFLGDIFLVNAATGDTYQVTYTPNRRESNITWTPDGQITFDETYQVQNSYRYSVEEALQIERPAEADIIYPPPNNTPYDIFESFNPLLSPDQSAAAWTVNSDEGELLQVATLRYDVDVNRFTWQTIVFEQPLPPDYEQNGVLIGWRPDPQNQ